MLYRHICALALCAALTVPMLAQAATIILYIERPRNLTVVSTIRDTAVTLPLTAGANEIEYGDETGQLAVTARQGLLRSMRNRSDDRADCHYGTDCVIEFGPMTDGDSYLISALSEAEARSAACIVNTDVPAALSIVRSVTNLPVQDLCMGENVVSFMPEVENALTISTDGADGLRYSVRHNGCLQTPVGGTYTVQVGDGDRLDIVNLGRCAQPVGQSGDGGVYDLRGIRTVTRDRLEELPPGVYICEGEKIVIQ